MGWLREFFRNNTKPIHPDRARKMRHRYASIYFFAAWNVFGLGVYLAVKNHLPDRGTDTPSQYYSRLTNTPGGTVYRFSGFTMVEKSEFRMPVQPPPGRARKARQAQEQLAGEGAKPANEKEDEDLGILIEETDTL